MATTEPQRDAATADGGTGTEGSGKKKSPWLWISIALTVVAAGLLIWGIKSQSDLDNAEQDVQTLQGQVEKGQQTGSALVAGMKDVFNDLKAQLSSSNADLAASEQQVKDAEAAAAQADQEAAAAKQQADKAKSQTDKANAEVEQAQAEAKAATSKLDVATGCAQSYVAAIGALFDGQSSGEVKQQLQTITADCKAAFAGT